MFKTPFTSLNSVFEKLMKLYAEKRKMTEKFSTY